MTTDLYWKTNNSRIFVVPKFNPIKFCRNNCKSVLCKSYLRVPFSKTMLRLIKSLSISSFYPSICQYSLGLINMSNDPSYDSPEIIIPPHVESKSNQELSKRNDSERRPCP